MLRYGAGPKTLFPLNPSHNLRGDKKTGLPDGAFTHVATNIGFHVVPDSQAALNGEV